MRGRRSALALVAALAQILSFSSLAAAEISVQGSVLAQGKKLAGATVRLVEAPDRAADFTVRFTDVPLVELARAKSDRDGYFSLLAPGTGFYRLIYEAEGHLSVVRWLNLLSYSRGTVTAVDLLPARKALLSVKDSEGKPIVAARLRLSFDEAGKMKNLVWPEFVSTGSDGRVALSLPQGEEGQAWIAVPGFAFHKEILAAGKESYEVKLEKGQEVAIEVVDGRRRALPNVAVFMPGTGMPLGITGKNGKVVVHVLPEHRQLGLYDAEGRRGMEALPQSLPEGLPGEQAKPFRFVLDEPPVLSGQVVELKSRLPVADAWVYIGGRPPLYTRSDRNGRFELVVPRARRSHLGAVKSGYRPASTEISEVSPSLVLALEPAAQVLGRVVDAAGVGIGGAEVLAASAKQPFPRSRVISDKEGHFFFEELEVGETLELHSRYENLDSPKVEVGPLAAGERATAELVLPQKIGFSCRVVDPDGKPIAQAEVFAFQVAVEGPQRRLTLLNFLLRREGPYLLALGTSDAEGRLRTTSLAAGTYDLGVLARGYGTEIELGVKVGRVSASEGAAEATTIVLQPAVKAEGKVVEERGKGLEGVTLRLLLSDSKSPFGRSTVVDERTVVTTDPQGHFEFVAVPAGQTFQLMAEREGFVDLVSPELVIEEGKSFLLEMRRAGRLSGKVHARGSALAGAFVRVNPISGDGVGFARHPFGAKTEGDGSFEIGGLDQISYRLQVTGPPGLQTFESEPFRVAAGEKLEMDVELEEASIVHGRVLRTGGEPVAEAMVHLQREGSMTRSFAHTDALGQYRIENAWQGAAVLRVQTPNGRSSERQVVLEEGVNEIDIELEKSPLGIAGRVVDSEGERIAGAIVYLDGDRRASTTSGADGTAFLEDLEQGGHLLRIEKSGYFFTPQVLHVGDVALEGLEWQMRPAQTRLVGQIYGLGAEQLAAVEVRALEGADTNLTGNIERGRYLISGLAEGRWTVLATVPKEDMAVLQEIEIHAGESQLEQDLDFGRVAGPWVGQVQKNGSDVLGTSYMLLSPANRLPLFRGYTNGSKIVLRVPAGPYRLQISGLAGFQELDIEVGRPSEQVIELDSQ